MKQTRYMVGRAHVSDRASAFGYVPMLSELLLKLASGFQSLLTGEDQQLLVAKYKPTTTSKLTNTNHRRNDWLPRRLLRIRPTSFSIRMTGAGVLILQKVVWVTEPKSTTSYTRVEARSAGCPRAVMSSSHVKYVIAVLRQPKMRSLPGEQILLHQVFEFLLSCYA